MSKAKKVKNNSIEAQYERSTPFMTALYYAGLGFNVVPIWPNTKRPMTVNGHKGGTTNLNIIRKRWDNCPKANAAICTDGLLVIDIDVKGEKNGYKAFQELEAKYGKLPVTRTQRTPSGGQHLIFRTQADIPSSIDCPAQGIDIRSRGGYILVEGSVIDGKYYDCNRGAIADAPKWLEDLVIEKTNLLADNTYDLYPMQSINDACISLYNASDVITINGMGHSLKVKYDTETNNLVIVQ